MVTSHFRKFVLHKCKSGINNHTFARHIHFVSCCMQALFLPVTTYGLMTARSCSLKKPHIIQKDIANVQLKLTSHLFFFAVTLRPNAGHGLLILEVSRSHTTTHQSRQDSSGRVISSLQRPLTDNIQHSQQTSMPPVGFEPTISSGELRQIYALDRAATGTGDFHSYSTYLTL